jgi:uncharacterized protein
MAKTSVQIGQRWFEAGAGEVLARTAYLDRTPRPTVVLLHGVGGSEASLYVRRAETTFLDAGYHVLCLNQRGAGDGANRASSLYHAGLTTDLEHVLRILGRERAHAGLYVLGFSGGGNVALRLAAEWGKAIPRGVRAVAGVSSPLDLTRAAANLERWQATPYRLHVLRGLIRGGRTFLLRQESRASYTWSDLLAVRSLRDFDARITVPMHGFASVNDYYEQAGAGPLLGDVELPSLVVHAEDDPMVPADSIWPTLRGASKHVQVEVLPRGGHLGFVSEFSRDGLTRTEALSRVLQFFAKHAPCATSIPGE